MATLLISSGLPQNLYGEAILTAKGNNKKLSFQKESNKKFCLFMTHYSIWEMERKEIQLEYFKVWGCLAEVQVPIPKRIKIGPMTVDCKIRLIE